MGNSVNSPASITNNFYSAYTCKNNHPIKFGLPKIIEDNYYEEIICNSCKINFNNKNETYFNEDKVRWVCETCNVNYCVFCKKLVLKEKCPNNHKIVIVFKSEDNNNDVVCDEREHCLCMKCGKSINRNVNSYEDKECALRFCESCYESILI